VGQKKSLMVIQTLTLRMYWRRLNKIVHKM
jgi:hypothetical protein